MPPPAPTGPAQAGPWDIPGASERDRRYHRIVARLLCRNDAFLDIVGVRVRRWIAKNGPRQPYLEWAALLARPSSFIVSRITADTREGDRLRALSPVIRMLTSMQREQVHAQYVGTTRASRSLPEDLALPYLASRCSGVLGSSSQLLSPEERALDHLLVRFAHSTFFPEDISDWMRSKEPFMNRERPIDVVRRNGVLALFRAVDAIDDAIAVLHYPDPR